MLCWHWNKGSFIGQWLAEPCLQMLLLQVCCWRRFQTITKVLSADFRALLVERKLKNSSSLRTGLNPSLRKIPHTLCTFLTPGFLFPVAPVRTSGTGKSWWQPANYLWCKLYAQVLRLYCKIRNENPGILCSVSPACLVCNHQLTQSATAAVNHLLECPQATCRYQTEIPFHWRFENFLPEASEHKIQTGR